MKKVIVEWSLVWAAFEEWHDNVCRDDYTPGLDWEAQKNKIEELVRQYSSCQEEEILW